MRHINDQKRRHIDARLQRVQAGGGKDQQNDNGSMQKKTDE
jgi:hypothetical protein